MEVVAVAGPIPCRRFRKLHDEILGKRGTTPMSHILGNNVAALVPWVSFVTMCMSNGDVAVVLEEVVEVAGDRHKGIR
eukprot:6978168-Pyramimonas_sp.AAC.1